MNNSEESIKYETQSSSGAIKSIIKNVVKTKDSNGIKIRSEHDWLCPVDSEEAERILEPNLSIVKSEYELQTNFLNWTLDKADDSAEEEEDAEGDNNDDKDWNHGGDTNKPITTEPIESTDDTIKAILEWSEFKECSRGNNSLYQKKRNFFEPYLLRACPYCGIEFESFTAWDTHLNDMHNYKQIHNTHFSYSGEGKVSCKECKSILSSRLVILKTHLLVHLPHMNIFKCKICVYACTKYPVLLSHIEIKHFDVVGESLSALLETSLRSCAYCGKYVGILKLLSTHIENEHGEVYEFKLFHVCPFCGEQFVEEKSHKEHLKNIHQFESLNGLSFELIEEQENNVNQKKYRCLKCSELFAGSTCSSTLINHALRHLPYKCFKCRYCEYENVSKSSVIQHTCKALLLDIKNNSMQTAKTTPLRKHLRKLKRRRRRSFDAINKLHVCPKCGENFEQRALWETHLIKVHRFDKYESLNIETTVSVDGKNKVTSCKICKKNFAKPCDFFIKPHAYIHMPYKIYKCKLCEASTNSLFVCHCQDISPLCVCPKCGKEFKQECNMKRHIINMHDLREPSTELSIKAENEKVASEMIKTIVSPKLILSTEDAVKNKVDKKERKVHRPKILKKKTQSDHLNIDTNNVENLEQTNMVKKPRCEVLKRSDGNIENRTELNITAENEEVPTKPTTKTIISTNLKLSTDNEVENKVSKKETNKNTQSDPLEIDAYIVEKFAQTSMAISTHKSGYFNKYSKHITYACPECNIQLATSEAWHTHIRTEHDFFAENRLNITPVPGVTGKAICDECCGTVHGSLLQKQIHKLSHMPYQAFVCNICVHRFIKSLPLSLLSQG